jgi:hypothetical protein
MTKADPGREKAERAESCAAAAQAHMNRMSLAGHTFVCSSLAARTQNRFSLFCKDDAAQLNRAGCVRFFRARLAGGGAMANPLNKAGMRE